VLDALYEAYFVRGEDIGALETLAAVAGRAGLDGATVVAQLATDAGTAEVLADVEFARQVGIRGVPFFIFNDRLAFSGAQPPDVIRRVLQQAAADHPPSQ